MLAGLRVSIQSCIEGVRFDAADLGVQPTRRVLRVCCRGDERKKVTRSGTSRGASGTSGCERFPDF